MIRECPQCRGYGCKACAFKGHLSKGEMETAERVEALCMGLPDDYVTDKPPKGWGRTTSTGPH